MLNEKEILIRHTVLFIFIWPVYTASLSAFRFLLSVSKLLCALRNDTTISTIILGYLEIGMEVDNYMFLW